MPDPQTGRLCAKIIDYHFGPVTASILSCLLFRGRLPLPNIVRITRHKPRIVAAAILILVQHNVLWHACTEDGEVLDVNVDDCLMRLRFGRFVWQAEYLYGKWAAKIIQVTLDHGKLRLKDIILFLTFNNPEEASICIEVIDNLVSSCYLRPATFLSHISPKEKQITYEAEEKAKITGFPSSKDLRQAKETAEVRLKHEEQLGAQSGFKFKLNNSKPLVRRISEKAIIDDAVYFRVNFDKFNNHFRDLLMVKSAKERYNAGAAIVLQTVLRFAESSWKSMKPVRSEPILVSSVILQLSDNNELTSSLVVPSKSPSKPACVRDYLIMLSSSDNPTSIGQAGAFLSLTTSNVQVEFELFCHGLRKKAIEFIIGERHGGEGVRILRLLMQKGKLDEKQISKEVMMAPKDVRPLLASLAADKLVNIQEVPKSSDRNPARTFYLWYVDPGSAHWGIISKLYKTLYNISMRRRSEGGPEIEAVLQKRRRTFISREELSLSTPERNLLKEWEMKQKKLILLESRIDEILFILHDLRKGDH